MKHTVWILHMGAAFGKRGSHACALPSCCLIPERGLPKTCAEGREAALHVTRQASVPSAHVLGSPLSGIRQQLGKAHAWLPLFRDKASFCLAAEHAPTCELSRQPAGLLGLRLLPCHIPADVHFRLKISQHDRP